MASFADLLHRADKLSSSVKSTKQDAPSSSKGWASSTDTTFNKGEQSFASSTSNRAPMDVVSGVDPNLDQILRRGETLWRKTTAVGGDKSFSTTSGIAGLNASLLLGREGVALPSFPEPSSSFAPGTTAANLADITLASRREPISKPQESDLQLFLRNQREQMLTNLVEETLKNTMDDAERMHWRQMVQDWEDHKKALFKGIPSVNVSEMVPGPTSRRTERFGPRSQSQMTDVELVLAKKMSEYVDASADGGLAPNLVALFADAVAQLKDTALVDLWDQVKEVVATPIVAGQSVVVQRMSVVWSLALIKQSTGYLQKHFRKHMEMVVYGNLEQAKRGGVPGTVGLVQAYLNVLFAIPYQGHEDGLMDNRHPVWAVVYYCIRSGDLTAARQVCEQMRLGDMAAALRQIHDGELSADTETKMRLEFRRKVLTGTDAFKRAVYCVVANCDSALDHPEVADKIEDWLWLRLTLTRHGELKRRADTAEKSTLTALQHQISVEFGEQHFAASGSPLMYWAALWLTGQLEAAIEFLSRQGDQLRANAVHIAIAANQSGILLTPKDCRVKLLSSEEGDSAELRRLNVARLVMLYTAKFETSDVREALCYMYLLRAFKAPSGEDLLEASVARLLAQTKEYDLLLGYIDESGKRMPGLVDRFKLNTGRIIAHVAREAESAGDNDTAVKLYDLAGKNSDAIRLLNMELSQVISQPCSPQSQCERVRRLAISLATRYKRSGTKTDPQLASTLYLLIDFGTFFDLYHEKRYDECIQVLRKLNCLPLEPEEVDQKVKIFHMIPEEIRRVLSDILLALMNISVEQYKQLKQSTVANNGLEQQALADIRRQAQAVILFAGMIPYRLPADTNGRLVQLEAYLS